MDKDGRPPGESVIARRHSEDSDTDTLGVYTEGTFYISGPDIPAPSRPSSPASSVDLFGSQPVSGPVSDRRADDDASEASQSQVVQSQQEDASEISYDQSDVIASQREDGSEASSTQSQVPLSQREDGSESTYTQSQVPFSQQEDGSDASCSQSQVPPSQQDSELYDQDTDSEWASVVRCVKKELAYHPETSQVSSGASDGGDVTVVNLSSEDENILQRITLPETEVASGRLSGEDMEIVKNHRFLTKSLTVKRLGDVLKHHTFQLDVMTMVSVFFFLSPFPILSVHLKSVLDYNCCVFSLFSRLLTIAS